MNGNKLAFIVGAVLCVLAAFGVDLGSVSLFPLGVGVIGVGLAL